MRLMEADIDGLEPVNVGNPVELTVGELADRVVELTGTTNRVIYQPLPQDDPRRRRPDITRARALLGWEPQVTLAQGLVMTCAWFAEELGRDAEQLAAE
jgi:UDP-glucuronate decarboxylase